MGERAPLVATFSIAACDLDAGQWGVAVQSKFLAVGSVVPWAEAHVGSIATQSYANPRYGPDGLALLRQGLSADEVVERLTAADEGRAQRRQAPGGTAGCLPRGRPGGGRRPARPTIREPAGGRARRRLRRLGRPRG